MGGERAGICSTRGWWIPPGRPIVGTGIGSMERRTFLKRVTGALGALFGLLLGVPGVAYLIDPRNRRAAERGFRRVARLSELPEPTEDGVPVPHQVVIRATRRDAWTLHAEEVIGRVWLVRDAENGVTAFTTICPHLGCSVNFDAAEHRFKCPCHNGTFEVTGERVAQLEGGAANPAPRGMDSLRVQTAPVPDNEDDDLFIEVKYENFRQGRHEKVIRT